MGEACSRLSQCQFHYSTYTNISSAFHLLAWQDSLCLRTSLTTVLADALGLHFLLSSPTKGEEKYRGDKRAGRTWAIGLLSGCRCGRRQFVLAESISPSRSETIPTIQSCYCQAPLTLLWQELRFFTHIRNNLSM